jgi:RNA polymerase-binding transcription factor DksA
MSHLSSSQQETLDHMLAERELELRSRVREAKAEAAERPSAQGPQVEDVGEEGEERARAGMEHLELQRDQEELTAIADARVRLAKGDHGTCVDCGQDISFERLSAQPTATRCVVCQDAFEKRSGAALRYSV